MSIADNDATVSPRFPSRRAQTAPEKRKLRPVAGRRSLGTMRAVGALVLREIATSYGRVSGGHLWAIAEPVGGILLLTIIFSLGFRNPPIGTNFAIFYATGLIPFLYYSDIQMKMAQAVVFSRQLLAYPAVTFIDALLGRLVTNVATQLLVAYITVSYTHLTLPTNREV